ncbi:hypothetical protein [Nocardioides antri]|uniref:Lipoprotein n=1 Tax=Nocardioides antri TaxID=2607659 RepID=A0A5B1MBK7_9ACTN|nr:hypothetical protein [Nocardioides antri]KAA1429399.1 hypothetical protein F0U47_04230 [Nocardioides antri]
MGPRSAALLPPLLLVCLLTSGCGSSDESARGPAEATNAQSSADPSGRPERRAEREEREAARCRELLPRVRLTYRITATDATDGSEIGLRMVLVNRSDVTVAGSTAGTLEVSAGSRSSRISWGGSSADELSLKPGTTLRREVWHDRKPPGWHPVGDRVTRFGFYAYTYAPGPGTVTCFIPATIVAPRGLVEGHPSGRWTQESTPP